MHTQFLLENLKGRDHSEDLGVDVRIIVEWMLGKEGRKLWTGWSGDHWWAIVNTVMNLWVP